jgi:predicted component of type VI protein secretion system
MRKRPIITVNAAIKRIKPAVLQRTIMTLTGQLETLSLAKKTRHTKTYRQRDEQV